LAASDAPDNSVTWDQQTFDLLVGMAVFVAILLLLAERAPVIAWTTLGGAGLYVLYHNSDALRLLTGQWTAAAKRKQGM
jgi:hypothetical protein